MTSITIDGVTVVLDTHHKQGPIPLTEILVRSDALFRIEPHLMPFKLNILAGVKVDGAYAYVNMKTSAVIIGDSQRAVGSSPRLLDKRIRFDLVSETYNGFLSGKWNPCSCNDCRYGMNNYYVQPRENLVSMIEECLPHCNGSWELHGSTNVEYIEIVRRDHEDQYRR